MQTFQSQRQQVRRPFKRLAIPTVALRSVPRVQAKPGCVCGGSCPACRDAPGIQAKLKIGAPDDVYEREADAVADRVMRMRDADVSASAISVTGATGTAMRQPMDDQEEEIQMKQAGDTALQLKGDAGFAAAPAPDTSHAAKAASRSGSPLSLELRAFFEPRFGYDFGQVRVHHDSEAAGAADSVQARAYTLGSDIVFNRNQFAPHTAAGKHMLAHELTHVLQQSGSSGKRVQGGGGADDPVRTRTPRHVQRAVNCGTECPARESGETATARGTQMTVAELRYPPGGFLVWDFAVGSGAVKGSLAADSGWAGVNRAIAAASSMRFEILGFTDCEGEDARNLALRSERAEAVHTALSPEAQARIIHHAGAPIADCIAGNDSASSRTLNRSAWIHLVEVNIDFPEEPVIGVTQPVYICTKPLDTAPLGNHALFRLGSPSAGQPTVSMQPSDLVNPAQGSSCIQGLKGHNYHSDMSAPGSCFLSTVSHAALLAEYGRYPTGQYCTLGPNSNSFVGHIARACGETRRPTEWVPGWDDGPPVAGTYAPNRYATLAGCATINCRQDIDGEMEPYLPETFEPQQMPGGGYMDRRGIVWPGIGPKF